LSKPKALPVRIEYGSESRLDLLRSLWLCLHHHHQSISPSLAPYVSDDVSWQIRRHFYAECLRSEGSFLLMAYHEEDLIGYALVLVQPTTSMWSDTWLVGKRTAELETIVVAPEWRSKGIGSLLMERVEAELEQLHIGDIIIGALPTNLEVLELYRRRGFEATWLIMTRFAARSKIAGR